MNIVILKQAGIDYDKGLWRCAGKTAIYERVLAQFCNEDALERAKKSFAAGNKDQLLRDVHEIKGVSGNLDMIPLYRIAVKLTELLRSEGYSDEELQQTFTEYEKTYLDMRNAILEAMEE